MKSNKLRGLFFILFFASIIGSILYLTKGEQASEDNFDSLVVPRALTDNFNTDFNKTSIEFDSIVQGVQTSQPKDAIPAISNPVFDSVKDSSLTNESDGLLVTINDESKFYPYAILVWHEIVNDTVGDTPISVTFCPLCGSGIVYNRQIDGNITRFGVSGFLRESNMIMYDEATESLWSQSTGVALVGDKLDTKLELIDSKLLTFEDVKRDYPEIEVLSVNTGFNRDYSSSPYGDYNFNDEYLFRPSSIDDRYPEKEVFYIVKVEDSLLAIRRTEFKDDQTELTTVNGITVNLEEDSGSITATNQETDEQYKGYFEMWFSFAVQNKDNPNTFIFDPSDI